MSESERPWPAMAMTKGDASLRIKDFAGALAQFTHALALASPDNHQLMVALLCRRAVALLYLQVRPRCEKEKETKKKKNIFFVAHVLVISEIQEMR